MCNYIEKFKNLSNLICKIKEKNFDFKCDISLEEVDIDDFEVCDSFDTEEDARKDLMNHLDSMDEEMSNNFETAVSEIIDFYEDYINNMEDWCYSWYEDITALITRYADGCDEGDKDMFDEIRGNISECEELIDAYIKELSDELADFKKNYDVFYKPSLSETYEYVDESNINSSGGYMYKGHSAYKKILRRWKNEFKRILTGADAVKNNLVSMWNSSVNAIIIQMLSDISSILPPEEKRKYALPSRNPLLNNILLSLEDNSDD